MSANSVSFSAAEVTTLLKAWRAGDSSALERLTPLVYAELHRLARRQMAREREGHLLQSSALVNEAYLRLLGESPVVIDWHDRNHFYAVSARLMRQVLIDAARSQMRKKRGTGAQHIDLSGVWQHPSSRQPDFLELDQALNRLAELDPRQASVVELRFFGGLENAEIAAILNVSEATVTRDWKLARVWLYASLETKETNK